MKFNIRIQNRVAEVLATGGELPLLVCDNTDTTVTFTFDAEWSAYATKTARFVYREDFGRGDLVYTDVSFTGDTATVPLLHNIREVWIGVIAGSLVTTSAARLSCLASVYGFSAEPATGGSVESETRTVTLLLSDGDQTVTASEGKLMSSVVIERPATLLPDNIRSGVTIAGVTGTYTGSSGTGSGDSGDPGTETATLGAPTIRLSGTVLSITPGAGATAERFDVFIDGFLTTSSYGTTVSLGDALSELSQDETHSIYVIAHNLTLSISSGRSNVLSYVPESTDEDSNAPKIRIEDDLLSITPPDWEVESYEILVGGETWYVCAAEENEIDLSYVLSDCASMTVELKVTAWNDTLGVHSEESETLVYTVPDAPREYTLSLSSDGSQSYQYAKNMELGDLADGGSEGYWSGTGTVSGITYGDTLVLLMTDTDYAVRVVSAVGCTVSESGSNSYGSFLKVTKLHGSPSLQLSVVYQS